MPSGEPVFNVWLKAWLPGKALLLKKDKETSALNLWNPGYSKQHFDFDAKAKIS